MNQLNLVGYDSNRDDFELVTIGIAGPHTNLSLLAHTIFR